ncbi:DUF490 domain-containing protein [Bacteroidia bacterium]|nr:DUF490 domain-containing protein [Bacteroidia bacterium]
MITHNKTIKNISRILLGALLCVIALFILILNSSIIQTNLANYFLRKQADKVGMTIKLQTFYWSIFKKSMDIRNVYVLDHHNQPMISAESLTVTMKTLNLQHLALQDLSLKNATIHVVNYVEDSAPNIWLLNALFSQDTTTTGGIMFECQDFDLRNAEFSYDDQRMAQKTNTQQMDFHHLRVTELNMGARNIKITSDTVFQADIRKLNGREQSGFQVTQLSLNVNFSHQNMAISQCALQTSESQIKMTVDLQNIGQSNLVNVTDKVFLDLNIDDSRLQLSELGYFYEAWQGMQDVVSLQGVLRGNIADFKMYDFIASYGQQTQLKGNLHVVGLPDIHNTYFDGQDALFSTSLHDIEMFVLPNNTHVRVPDDFKWSNNIVVNGDFKGFFDDFETDAVILTDYGQMNVHSVVSTIDSVQRQFSGVLSSQNIELARLFPALPELGNLDMMVHFEGRIADNTLVTANVEANIDDFEIDSLPLHDIHVSAVYKDKNLSLNAKVRDDVGNAALQGTVDFGEPLHFTLLADVQQCDLVRYGWIKDSVPCLVTTLLTLDCTTKNLNQASLIDKTEGLLTISNTQLQRKDSLYAMTRFLASQRQTSDGYVLQIINDYFTATLSGYQTVSDLRQTAQYIQNYYQYSLARSIDFIQGTSSLFTNEDEHLNLTEPAYDEENRHLHFDVSVKSVSGLAAYFFPFISFPYGATATLNYVSTENEKNAFDFNIQMQKAQFKTISIGNFKSQGKGVNDQFDVELTVLDFNGDNMPTIHRLQAKGGRIDNVVNWETQWDGNVKQAALKGFLKGSVNMLPQKRAELAIVNSEIYFDNHLWTIEPNNQIDWDTLGLQIKEFNLLSKDNDAERLNVHGWLSKIVKDPIILHFDHFDMSVIDLFTKPTKLDFSGFLNGDIQVFDVLQTPYLQTDIQINEFAINDHLYGLATLETSPNQQLPETDITFNILDTETEARYFTANGYYRPKNRQDRFALFANFFDMDLSFVKNYIQSFSSYISGTFQGNATFGGNFKDLVFNCHAEPVQAQLGVDYLNTKYNILSGDIDLSLDYIKFNNFVFKDTIFNTTMTGQGIINHRMFYKTTLDINLNTNKTLALNTTYLQNEDFFGTVFCSGPIRVAGNMDKVTISGQVKTEKGTKIQIPFNNNIVITEGNFVTFVEHAKKDKEAPVLLDNIETDLDVAMDVNITPDAKIIFDMDVPPTTGIINADGNGNLRFNLLNTTVFEMFGDYVIQNGFYDFSLQDLIVRRFTIENGSTISWINGEPYEAIINLSAVYSTRASLFPVLADNTTSSDLIPKGKVSVQSVIGLTGILNQPTIKFDFRLPGVDDDIRAQFLSLVTQDENELAKQTFYLLLFDAFTTAGNTSDVPYSGESTISIVPTGVLTNQLNNLLSKLDLSFGTINPEFGINLKPEDPNNTTLYQFQMTTRMFNNKLIFDGNFGYGGTAKVQDPTLPPNTQSEFMTDASMEYRISNHLSAKIFQRPNEKGSIGEYLRGLSLGYKTDFQSINQLFRRKKKEPVVVTKDRDSI